MNIEKLKQQADEQKVQQEKIQACQANAISEFDKFFSVMDKSYPLWNDKMKAAVDRFTEDFKEYFKQNGFEVISQNPFGQGGTITEIEATYKDLKFKLANINYDGEHMYIYNSDNVSAEIWFALSNDTPNYFVWKDNIVIGEKRLVDMNASPLDSYKDFVKKFVTEDEINTLVSKIRINTNHFQAAIDHIADTDLYIHRFGTESTYKDFKELIEEIDV